MLKGERILLRPPKEADIPLFLKWLNDPEIIQYLDLYLPLTETAEEKWLEDLFTNRADTDIILVIEVIDKENNIPIGNIGLSRINYKDRKAEFGIFIGEKEYWNQGYGPEAARVLLKYGFQQLNLNRIHSIAYDFNERSLVLHKKLGFVEEGRQRQAVFKNGQYHDEIMFGLLRKEWKG